MESDIGTHFVNSGTFHHVLKFFDPEEMLKLRSLSSCMKERVVKELFTNTEVSLHENTFTEDLGKQIENAKKLVIETIQFTDNTTKLFSNLSDHLFESIDTLVIKFSTD